MIDGLRLSEIDACLHKIELKRTEPFSKHRATPTDEQERRRREAEQLRERVLADLVAAHPGTETALTPDHALELMAGGTEVILRARLETKSRSFSAVAPVLVRVGKTDTGFSYAPLIIKNHEITETAQTRSLRRTSVSPLLPSAAEVVEGIGLRSTPGVRRDTIQLAGMSRILHEYELHDPHWRGGIIDRRGDLYWVDLTSEQYPKANLGYFDQLLSEREALISAMQIKAEGTMASAPYWHRECTECQFAQFCQPVLEEQDDVSLVRFTNRHQQQLLRSNGITTRAQLAGLDPQLALQAKIRPTSVPGLESTLSPSFDRLDDLIYRARAHQRGTALRILDPNQMGCPTADVEVDVDMESYGDGTYLWGAYVSTTKDVEGIEEGYRSFATFDELTFEREQQIFYEFWRWFSDLREKTLARGLTFAGYCFWEHAENSAMNRAVDPPLPSGPTIQLLDEFRSATPKQWFDLHAYAKQQIQTEGPLGLKQLATATGFAWRDEAPSGEASMSWYEVAIGDAPAEALASQHRLLQYNEDDCRATKALREWLNGPAKELPHRDDFPG